MTAKQPGADTALRGVAAVIGSNAKRLRTNQRLTLNQVSIALRSRGLTWSESRVADFEAGRVVAAGNIETLAAYCLALADAGCAGATVPNMLRTVAPIQLNDSLLLYDQDLINLLSGIDTQQLAATQSRDDLTTPTTLRADEWKLSEQFTFEPATLLMTVWRSSGATEERVRRALGISSMLLAHVSAALWGSTFSEERDRRAGEGANAQKRGQMTRQLRAELTTAIEGGKRGDGS
jgi:hypothetical protein